jgi:hypothetical protein
MEDLQLENTCYVLVQTNVIHPCADPMRHKMVWYPERGMTLLDCVQYKPYVRSIVTENCWIISCYQMENVRIFSKEYGWIRPNNQTYGASINWITMKLLRVRQTIPSTPLDGGKEIKELIKELESEYRVKML